MRNLKFRGWDGHEMVYPGDNRTDKVVFSYVQKSGHLHGVQIGIGDYDWSVIGPYWFEDDPTKDLIDHAFAFMQSTGLQDKAGKDIYEGDILLVLEAGEPTYWTVGFHNGSYCMCCEGSEELIADYEGEVEIAGNIYQNPELINL